MGGPSFIYPVVRTGLAAYAAYSNMRGNRTQESAKVSSYGNGGSTVTRRKYRTGRRRRPTLALLNNRIIAGGPEFIYRWQQTSPTFLGPGRVNIGWHDNNAPNSFKRVPIHFISLTSIPPELSIAYPAKGCFHQGLCRTEYNPVDGQFQYIDIKSQESNGSNGITSVWRAEHSSAISNLNFDRVFHKYSDIRINLYGTYTVPIRYRIFMVQLPEQLDPFQYSGFPSTFGEGSELNNMFKDWTRTLLHNTVATNGDVKWPKDVRIIKQHNVLIQPLTYSDQLAEREISNLDSSTAPHIHEVRWFVRHDRFRDYKWSENSDQTDERRDYTKAQWDVTYPTALMSDVEWGKRVFLFITATSPRSEALSTEPDGPDFQGTAQTFFQGSYDINIRNCWRFFKC